MAGTTRLELATSAVTGQRSNQLNYVPTEGKTSLWWALKDLNLRPFGCKPNALTAELSALPEPLQNLTHPTGFEHVRLESTCVQLSWVVYKIDSTSRLYHE